MTTETYSFRVKYKIQSIGLEHNIKYIIITYYWQPHDTVMTLFDKTITATHQILSNNIHHSPAKTIEYICAGPA